MSATEEFLAANRSYVQSFDKGDKALPPGKRVAVLACMDARIETGRLLGLEEGDAHVIRNAGGVVTRDVIRSLIVSQRLQGTREVMLIHHTDCGMLKFKEDDLRRQLRQEAGSEPEFSMRTFIDLEADIRESIERIKACPYLPHRDEVRGFVYDVDTGLLHEVI